MLLSAGEDGKERGKGKAPAESFLSNYAPPSDRMASGCPDRLQSQILNFHEAVLRLLLLTIVF